MVLDPLHLTTLALGAWFTTIFVVVALKALFTLIPFITPEASWTLTNLSFNWVRRRD